MNSKRCFLLVIVATLCLASLLRAQGPQEIPDPRNAALEKTADNYFIGPGDVLDISLWKDESLTRQVTVLADGTISFPLIGEVPASGKTLAALKEEISQRLARYVPEPVLSIEVKQSNSLVIYVTGKVNNPGRHVVNSNVTILQALSIAGGLNPFAKRGKIRVLRQEQQGLKMFPFDYDEVIDGENTGQNIALHRGDVVVVP